MQTPRQVATSQTYPGRAKYGSRESRLECIENPFLWRARKPHASALSSGCDAHDQQVRHAPWDRGAQESRSLLVGHRYRYPFGAAIPEDNYLTFGHRPIAIDTPLAAAPVLKWNR